MSQTDKAMTRLREMIQSGELPPGAQLPPEQELASELGVGRNIMREAVRALVAARVLEVRRGNGTFVTSLEPRLLLQGISSAVELLRGATMLELTEVRRLFESAATGLAASRMSPRQLAEVRGHLDAMRAAANDVERDPVHGSRRHLQPYAARAGVAGARRRGRRRPDAARTRGDLRSAGRGRRHPGAGRRPDAHHHHRELVTRPPAR
jgi:GntR family transcriptional regulator, transcriptional repressor for pyruvate dehydrogenase complex